MDPDIALDKLRELCRETIEMHGAGCYQAEQACELFEALDQWLSSGEQLPYEWQDARKP